MYKSVSAVLIMILCVSGIIVSQEKHEASVTNIEVPVRVYQEGRFVEGLRIEDFELTENGAPQKIDAVYLTKGTQIQSRDIQEEINPFLRRQFYFMFQMTDYHPRLPEALAYFFENIFKPGDSLSLITPLNQYNLSPRAIEIKPPAQLVANMQKVIRKDIQVGSSEYNSMLKDLQRIVQVINTASGSSASITTLGTDEIGASDETGLRYQLPRYRETLSKMEEMRIMDEKRFLTFASHLKQRPGEKIVFFFYQREFRPEIQNSVLNRLVSLYQDKPDIIAQVQDLFQIYSREVNLRTHLINQAFADSEILFNLLFFNKSSISISGVNMREQSEDYFRVFSGIAQFTGGMVDSSQNPAAAFKTASERADRCYLVYYSPENPKKDNEFRNIEIKIKGRDYKVTHRNGYFTH